MTSNELNEILNKTRRTPNISLTPEQVEEIVKDLEQKELLESELKLEKDKVKYVMKQLKKQDKLLNVLKKNADYRYDYDEWCGMRGNQCIMICITENDECFEEIREMIENYGKD